ncbi:MAG: hypothetical protein DRR04_08575 [Gammaproteobacteria bacterium]|nr:MAG: hypothetical protein DRQ97_05325 [Gammaproteobacteria bacterium]RLA59398.1 MAG: hypothetical protein DRR04_08575 [Gammaproteobacteria bacterium]
MPDKANRRRFIAGAVCPRCASMDKIVVNLDTDQRECVACGFSEERPDPGQVIAPVGETGRLREVPTRVSRPAARRMETPAEAITLIDPGEDGK